MTRSGRRRPRRQREPASPDREPSPQVPAAREYSPPYLDPNTGHRAHHPATGREAIHVVSLGDYYELNGIPPDDIEVTGLFGFTNTRCPYSESDPICSCGRYSYHLNSLVVAVDGACPGSCRVNNVVVKSDSAYLVNGASKSLKKWQGNGWQTANRTAVKNRDLWEELARRIEEFKGLEAEVEFWLVPRDMNTEADALANEGLRSGMCLGEDGLEVIGREWEFEGGGLGL
ncbi:hypothetical protein C8A05DRAFT_20266 [Staphylotrichum tortipilum]|uniref:RNase H type-1 domain-containing protein n=1 Tax=Staphylotrichum tortipilum TaxID=2831512 RepID=A0AAN6MB75_9PEZI|nr:hypothetical protein C8A05DRAFT_20266 [Staphylotrichum longicolle]